ncbi:NAD(P)-binding domain-containing protein [Bordetella genomosp. 1]|uniref:6-phosphogluconate dehydrogenase NADP-binding domain-containing protein n=1 Tax=Bordetella genomosp. 1 TaxID=1395607 RepID=A0ABX4F160_9BORD|nr:NAD(P)-binding domain-containing protein [Bordetella genomosp. 1]MDQ8032546.1 NAD(P)-binding domain-containing protein [Bordetella sp.]OZI65394.1 hypothetical protein CAL27_10165 [Bordetella genomosp. 1]
MSAAARPQPAWHGVSVIGLSEAGCAAARDVAANCPELALTVYDPDGARCESFRGLATLAANVEEALRESDVIVLALPDGHAVDRTLARYSDGQVNADVAGKLIVDLCARDPRWTQRLGDAVRSAGAGYADAAEPAALLALIAPRGP